jgi:TolB-like protein
MSVDLKPDLQLEVAHVLFIDVVGYSKQVIEEQRALQHQLNQIVRNTEQFRLAEAEGKLVRLPSGDGMALVFFGSTEAPVQCAVEISGALSSYPQLKLRMGINTGPVSGTTDVNDRSNVAGAGINMAERVMSLGDAGHILLSKRAAEDLVQYRRWQPHLHDLGEVEVKHGVKLSIVNLYTDKLGNAAVPEKLKQETRKQATSRRRRRTLIAALFLAIAALFVGSLIFVRWSASRMQSNLAAITQKSIAVLPFENLSDDKANSFFADGMQDEILSDLAKVAALKVISRTSVMQYKNVATRNMREIAQQLGVAHVLEGRVQRAANRIRVNAQLIDARTDAHLWAEHYDRDLADVFAVQSEIATSIVERLRTKLSPAEKSAIEEKPTADLAAYDLYLRAKALDDEISTSKDWEADIRRAVDLLDQAVARDPNFALAYCLLCKLNFTLYAWVDKTSTRLALVENALKNAVRIAPESGETYLVRGRWYMHERNWQRALDAVMRAGKLLPGSVDVLTDAADIKPRLGRWSEATRDLEKAKELDPANPNIANGLTDLYSGLRDYSRSDQVADAAIAKFPNGPGYFQAAKVNNAIDRGDIKAARVALAAIAPGWDPSGITSDMRVAVAVADRNYAEAAHLLATTRRENLIEFSVVDLGFFEALVARKQGDNTKATSVLVSMHEKAAAHLHDLPDDINLLSRLARIDAYLGRNDEALREIARATELAPDAVGRPGVTKVHAEVCLWTGQRDKALELLSQVATIPNGPSYGDLLSPRWDSLRGDPRFQTIVAAAKAARR